MIDIHLLAAFSRYTGRVLKCYYYLVSASHYKVVVCFEAGDYSGMPPVKEALILLPVCWPSLSFEDFAQFQLLPRACKHSSALISSQIWLWPQEAQAR